MEDGVRMSMVVIDYALDVASGGHGVVCVYRAWFRYLLDIVSGAEWG